MRLRQTLAGFGLAITATACGSSSETTPTPSNATTVENAQTKNARMQSLLRQMELATNFEPATDMFSYRLNGDPQLVTVVTDSGGRRTAVDVDMQAGYAMIMDRVSTKRPEPFTLDNLSVIEYKCSGINLLAIQAEMSHPSSRGIKTERGNDTETNRQELSLLANYTPAFSLGADVCQNNTPGISSEEKSVSFVRIQSPTGHATLKLSSADAAIKFYQENYRSAVDSIRRADIETVGASINYRGYIVYMSEAPALKR